MAEWKESEHPRDVGRFTKKLDGSSYRSEVNERIRWAKENNIELPLNDDGSLNDIKLRELWEKKRKPPEAYGFADKTRKNTKHHKRHAQEMGFKNQDEYERAAVEFFNSDKGKLYYGEARDRFYRYDEETHIIAISSNGIIHTFGYRTPKEFLKMKEQERLNER